MRLLLFFSVFCFLLSSCAPRERQILIVATNDIHAQIDRFPALATLVAQQRAEHPGRVLLLDAGDRWSGNPYVDMVPEGGQPIIALMDSLGYDLATLGNHEFDFGLELLRDRLDDADFEVLCANLDSNGSILPQPAPYRLVEVDGVKFGVVGLIMTANGGYPAGLIDNFGPIKFSNALTKAPQYRSLADSCDVLIALTHIGFGLDTLLAHDMPQIDLIVGGHSHTRLPEGHRIGEVLVTQAGGRLEYASLTTLTLRGKELVGIENRLVKLDTIAPDPRYEAMVARYKDRPELQRVAGSLTEGLNKTGLMNLTTDMIRARVGADLAIYNRGGVRLDTLAGGDVRVAQLYAMEPFGNTIQTIAMPLADLKTLILNLFNGSNGDDHRIDIHPSGFTYTIVCDAAGEAIDVELKLAGKPAPSGIYRVAAPNYLFQNYTFPAKGLGVESAIRIGSAMVAYFGKQGPITGDNTPRAAIMEHGTR